MALLWLLAGWLLMGSNPTGVRAPVPIIQTAKLGVLAAETDRAWPLISLASVPELTEWPYWFFAAVAAGLLSYVFARKAAGGSQSIAAFFVTAFAVSMEPRHLVPAALLVWAGRVVIWSPPGSSSTWLSASSHAPNQAAEPRPLGAFVVSLVVMLVAAAFTVDFGLILLVVGLALLNQSLSRPAGFLRDRAGWMVFAGGVIVTGCIAVWMVPSFGNALIRPFSALWVPLPAGLFSRLESPWVGENLDWQNGLLLGVVCGCWWILVRDWNSDVRPWSVWLLSLLTMIGLGSAYFLWLCAFAAVVMIPRRSTAVSSVQVPYVWGVLCLLIVAGRFEPSATALWELGTQGESSVRLVDPTRWETTGRVMLTNLDQAGDWQSRQSSIYFDLLVDDRWDVFAEKYPEYGALCDDISHVRAESYVRQDATWGGYLLKHREWEPALYVVDTSDVDAIRRMAFSPHWSLMGLDARRTIFGRPQVATNRQQIQNASSVLATFEWRGTSSFDSMHDVVAVGDRHSRRRVAAALGVLRMPYASLRLVAEDAAESTEMLRCWNYLELAHRHHRYSGEISLLDQPRAIFRLLKFNEAGRLSKSELMRIQRVLTSLRVGEDRISQLLNGQHRPPMDSVGMQVAPNTVAEERMRKALANGDRIICSETIPHLEPAIRDYYALLFSAAELPAESTSRQLGKLLASNLPDRLRGEALYYLACLNIEVGDSAAAIESLQSSTREEPHAAYDPLRQLALQMVQPMR